MATRRRTSKAPTWKRTTFVGAEAWGLPRRAPLMLKAHEPDALAELLEPTRPEPLARVIDASWASGESSDEVLAVGTVVHFFDDEAWAHLREEHLPGLAPFGGAEVTHTREVPARVAGQDLRLQGVCVSGAYEHLSHRARALLVPVPESRQVVSVVATIRCSRGYFAGRDRLDPLFEKVLDGLVVGDMGPRTMRPSWVSSRAAIATGGMLVASEDGIFVGKTGSPDAEASYLEVPAGLFEVGGYESEVVALDARGHFRFRKSFSARFKPQLLQRRFKGLTEPVPVHRWVSEEGIGQAIVRDGVLHLIQLSGESPMSAAAILDSLSFLPAGANLHGLLEHAPSEARGFRPMPPSPPFRKEVR